VNLRSRRAVALVLAAVALTACSDDDPDTTDTAGVTDSGQPSGTTDTTAAATTTTGAPTTTQAPTTTAAPSTTVDPVALATAFAERGPYEVGVTTLQLAKGPLVEIWYPAVEGTTGTTGYDVRDFTPPAIEELLTADVPATYEYDGARDVEVADGAFPVVLFSHGFTGIRVQSSFLTSHLASHGMIVVAPDHPSRDLPNVLGGTASGDRNDAVDDLLAALDLIVEEGATPGGRFEGRVDAERVAALGHSAGGGTVLGAALDPRVDAYVSMAAGGPPEGSAFPSLPSFFLAGATDGVVPPAERTRPAFESAATPSWFWEIEATGHNGFDDFCTFGNGTGIIGIAEASGLGAFLDAQPQLRALGEDGCVPPAAPVEQTFPIVRHGVTSFLRWTFGEDETPVGLGPEVDGAYELGVTAEQR
jgi:predicted dienelactone hydrolase